jgi:hypothetical protein
MTAYAGSSLVVTWIQSAATTILTGDHKSLTYTPSISFYDQTAGADTHKSYISGVKDGSLTFNAVMQAGTGSGGTLTYSTLTEGAAGTLRFQPEGTASPNPKYEVPALSQGAQFSYPYDNVVEVTVNFQQNGARSESANS